MPNIQNKTQSKPRFAKLVRVVGFTLGAAVLLPWGSFASAQDAFIEVDTAPRYYSRRPHAVYHGDHAYYVDGRWYARHGRRWGYYRDEPRDLVRYRHDHHEREYRSPRAHRHHHHDHVIEVRD
jgi:hypothetical protein